MRPTLLSLVLTLVALLALPACGETRDDASPGPSHATANDSGTRDAALGAQRGDDGGADSGREDSDDAELEDAGIDTGAGDAGSDSDATYSGSVVADLTASDGGLAYQVYAGFVTGSESTSYSCTGMASGDCCETATYPGTAIPIVEPTAGDVTVALSGTPIVTLSPQDYEQIGDVMWGAGDVLSVSAVGAAVAPFTGTLATPSVPSGVTPSIGSSSIDFVPNGDFQLSWTPEGKTGETMLFLILQTNASGAPVAIRCSVPDSAGVLLVDGELLRPLSEGAELSLSLTRSLSSTVSSANATIKLTGESTVYGSGLLQSPPP